MKKPLNKKLIIILAAVLVVVAAAGGAALFLLNRGGEEEEVVNEVEEETEPEPIPAPLQYVLEENSVTALPVGDVVVVTCEETVVEATEATEPSGETGEEAATEETGDGNGETEDTEATEEPTEEEPSEEETTVSTYRYEGVPTAARRVADYCTLLTAEDFGFTPVDAAMMETALPDFEAPDGGSVHLVKPVTVTAEDGTESGGYLFSLRLSWGAEHCLVTPELLVGSIVVPAPEPELEPGAKSFTLMEAVDHVKAMEPQVLGLTGESMEDYRIYVLDGAAMVGDTPCLRLGIYSESGQATNQVAGQYFMTNDGLHMYLLTDSGSVRQLY